MPDTSVTEVATARDTAPITLQPLTLAMRQPLSACTLKLVLLPCSTLRCAGLMRPPWPAVAVTK